VTRVRVNSQPIADTVENNSGGDMNIIPVETTKRAYRDLADYAERQGAPESAFVAAGWYKTTHLNRPALEFPTATGPRWRAIDGKSGWKYISPKGYQRCWYGLDTALAIAEQTGHPLVMVNGEAGTVVAQYHCIPAICMTGGEAARIPDELLAELQAQYNGEIIIALDCDTTGRKGAVQRAGQIAAASYNVRAVDLQLGDKGDIADFCKLNGYKAAGRLENLPIIEPEKPKPTFQRRETKAPASASQVNWDEERRYWWLKVVLPAIEQRTSARRGKHFRCINPHHNDNDPSARISPDKDSDGLYVCTCGAHSRETVASWLGMDFMGWWTAERKPLLPKVEKQQKQKPVNEERPWPPKLPPVKLNTFTPDQTVQARYVSDIDLSARTLALKSPLNTGKTTAQIEHIKRHKPSRVLFLTYLQSLVGNITERLNASDIERKFESYLDIPSNFNLGAIDYLVCSLNSIHRLQGAEAYDLVVIDEAEQTVRALWDGTLDGEESLIALATLKDTVSRAGQVIALDAHMSDQTANVLESIRGGCTKIENTYFHQWGDLVMYREEAALIAAAEACADKDTGCVVITTGSRAAARRYRRYFEQRYGVESVRLVYGWNSAAHDVRAFLRNINETLPTLRVFICSPTVGTGVDVQAKVAGVFGHFSGGHLAATDILQQIARYRNATQRGMFIDHKQRSGLIIDPDQLLGRERAKVRRTATLAEFAKYGTVNVSDLQGEITKLWASFTAATNRQKVNVLAYFVALAEQEGFSIRWSTTEAPAMKGKLKANAQALRGEDDQKILTLAPVSRIDLDNLRMSGELAEDDFLGYERWKIEDTTGQEISEELLAAFGKQQNRAALRRFTDYLSSIEFVRQKDRENVRVLPFQRGHHVANRLLFENALQAVFGDKGLTSTEVIEASELEHRAAPFIQANTAEIRQLDRDDKGRTILSEKPIAMYRRLLKRFGVHLSSKQVRLPNGERGMVYWLDQSQIVVFIEHARRRMAYLETLSKNRQIQNAAPDSTVFRQRLHKLPSAPSWKLTDRPQTVPTLDLAALRKAGPVNPFSKKAVAHASA